jgi:hypothetical protein
MTWNSGQSAFSHPAEEPGERGISRYVGTQDHGVDEEPDQLVQCHVGAPGHRRAQRDVIARAQPGQQH